MISQDNLFNVQNDTLSLVVDAAAGARIVSLRFKGVELLTQPEVHPQNYGSTLWYAPQSHWQWPPPAALDSAPYVAVTDNGRWSFTSSVDAASGLQFIKRFRLHDQPNHVELEYIIRNTALQPVAAAAWELTRMPGWLTFFPSTCFAERVQSTLPDVQIVGDTAWYTLDKAHLPISSKAFFDLNHAITQGWLASITPQRLLFVKSFPVLWPQDYSDGHAAVEVYAHEQGAYVELENHGSKTLLQQNDSLSYIVRWFVQAIPDDIDVRAGNPQLVEFAQALINTKKS